jgi:uroporphyrin-III C-methyltransferase
MATPTPSKSTPNKKHLAPKRTPWLIATLAMLLALAALFMTWQLTQTIQQKTHAFDTAIIMLNGQQSNNEARLATQHANTETIQATWQAKLDTLNNTLKTTLKEYANLSDDWRLLKARHLLELAALNAHWSTDKDATVAMLREADTFLAPIHNPKLLPVREGLAQDITEQLSAPTTDVTALLTRLNAIQVKTFHLPVTPLPTEALPENMSEKPGRMGAITNFLKNLVVIRYKTDTLEPKPTLAYEAMLRATVRLNLQEAEWAILERNDAIYHVALTQAMTNLEHTFLSEAASTQALIGQIKQLDTTQLRTDLIIPEQGLTVLNHLINTPIKTRLSPDGENAL